MQREFDAIVVGAGVGGLMAANVLAGAGLRVLLAEQGRTVGGCCSSIALEGYRFDAAVHHVSGGGAKSLIGQALAAVGAKVRMVRLDPMDVLVWPDASFEVPGDWERLMASLATRFPREARGIHALFQELVRLYRAILGSPGGAALLARWSDTTFHGFLSAFVDDELLIRILSGQWGYLGEDPESLSAVGMCQMLVNYWRDGAWYPIGGTQAIPDALAAAFRAKGGVLRTSAAVRRILVNGDGVQGVSFASGELAFAPTVVSNADVPQTVHRLLDGRVPAAYAEDLRALRVSRPFFLLYLGLGRGFRPRDLPRGFYHRETRLGGPWLYVSCATEVDPSLAPRGKHAVTVVVSLTREEEQASDWNAAKDAMIDAVLAQLDAFAPGFRGHVEVVRSAHPPHPKYRTASFCGAPYGWAVVPGQSGPRRLSASPPVRGLHLAGHWTTPGPGVCAVIASGWQTANSVLATRSRLAASVPPAVTMMS